MFHKKRGYFFIIDAVIALFILVLGVVLITSFYIKIPSFSQVDLISFDLLKYMSDTQIKSLNNDFGGIGGELWNNGTITDADNTLVQQIGEFYTLKNNDIAEEFIINLSKDIVPEQFRYEVWMEDTILYPRVQTQQHNISKNSTEILVLTKGVTFGLINKTPTKVWGPYNVRVMVWQK